MEKENVHISVVSPVYGCSTSLVELYIRLKETLSKITNEFEIILVNDGSPDEAWIVISELCNRDNRVKGINLSRNFGQHYAITAGLDNAKGDWIVVMDCDLQDLPEEIENLYKKALDGYDSVFAQRQNRSDAFLKRINSKLFYLLYGFLTDTKQDNSVANFGIYKKDVILSVLKMKDQIRYFPTMIQWVGFNKFYLPVSHGFRTQGKSSYSFNSLLNLAISNIIAFSDKPLKLTVKLGFAISLISFTIGIVYLILYLNGNIVAIGFTSLIISIWLLAGIVIALLGIVGLYIGKVFEKVKDRPQYLVKNQINNE